MAEPKDLLDEAVYTQLLLTRYDSVTDREYANSLNDFRETIFDEALNSRLTKKKISQINKSIDSELKSIYKDLDEDLEEDTDKAASISYNSSVNALSTHATDIDAPVWSQLPKTAIKTIVGTHKIMELRTIGNEKVKIKNVSPFREIKKLSKQHRKFYKNIIMAALIEGKGEEEVLRDIRETADLFDNGKQNQIRALVRTTIAEAMHDARAYGEDSFFSDVITGFEWVSVLDLRTTFVCASRNGKIEKKREDFNGLPPLHFGCRSIVTGLTELADTQRIDRRWAIHDETITGTRQGELKTKFTVSRGGDKTLRNPDQGSKKSLFDSWFANLPANRQAAWLGPERYKMYKRHGLSTGDLVTGTGRKLTVEEIAKGLNLSKKQMANIRSHSGKNKVRRYKPKVTKPAQKIIREREKLKQAILNN